jgi:hypothetical protein
VFCCGRCFLRPMASIILALRAFLRSVFNSAYKTQGKW